MNYFPVFSNTSLYVYMTTDSFYKAFNIPLFKAIVVLSFDMYAIKFLIGADEILVEFTDFSPFYIYNLKNLE